MSSFPGTSPAIRSMYQALDRSAPSDNPWGKFDFIQHCIMSTKDSASDRLSKTISAITERTSQPWLEIGVPDWERLRDAFGECLEAFEMERRCFNAREIPVVEDLWLHNLIRVALKAEADLWGVGNEMLIRVFRAAYPKDSLTLLGPTIMERWEEQSVLRRNGQGRVTGTDALSRIDTHFWDLMEENTRSDEVPSIWSAGGLSEGSSACSYNDLWYYDSNYSLHWQGAGVATVRAVQPETAKMY